MELAYACLFSPFRALEITRAVLSNHGKSHGRMDGQTTYCGITVLCTASHSHSENCLIKFNPGDINHGNYTY